MSANKIIHGDCRENLGEIKDGSVNCIVTDPPYGVNFWSRSAETAEGKKWVKKIENDGNIDSAIALFHEVMTPLVTDKMGDEGDLYVFTRWDIVDVWMQAVRDLPGIAYKMLLVWDKGSPGMGDIDSNWGCGHELILYAKKGRRKVSHRRSGILAFDRVHPGAAIHPTEKPVPLLEKLISMSTDVGDLVVDPFSGSGSTSVAAMNLDRNSIAFEIDEDHFKRSIERLSQDTLF